MFNSYVANSFSPLQQQQQQEQLAAAGSNSSSWRINGLHLVLMFCLADMRNICFWAYLHMCMRLYTHVCTYVHIYINAFLQLIEFFFVFVFITKGNVKLVNINYLHFAQITYACMSVWVHFELLLYLLYDSLLFARNHFNKSRFLSIERKQLEMH